MREPWGCDSLTTECSFSFNGGASPPQAPPVRFLRTPRGGTVADHASVLTRRAQEPNLDARMCGAGRTNARGAFRFGALTAVRLGLRDFYLPGDMVKQDHTTPARSSFGCDSRCLHLF
jgi:hypothetical protein